VHIAGAQHGHKGDQTKPGDKQLKELSHYMQKLVLAAAQLLAKLAVDQVRGTRRAAHTFPTLHQRKHITVLHHIPRTEQVLANHHSNTSSKTMEAK
jgi:hypothetical protein